MDISLIEGDKLLLYLCLCCGFAVALEKSFAHSVNELCIHETACTIPTDTNLPLGHCHIVGISIRNEDHVYA